MEMTKRGVPGVWTYGFYDGWVPNYMFFIAHTHNAIGRFYEVQSFCQGSCGKYSVRPGATTTSKEWFRPNPPLDSIVWSPRANTNIQESALLFSLSRTAKDKEMFLENYWLKNKRAVAKGKTKPGTVAAWVIPANQHARQNAAEAVNELKTQGLEFHTANSSFKAGNVQVNAGDYIIRGDQPYRTIADMYFSLQNFSPANPSPYDDTGWTFPLMRNITVTEVTDKSILKAADDDGPMKKDVVAAGGISGTGSTVIVENNSDNSLVSFRFKNPSVKMAAAEDAFSADGHNFARGRDHHREREPRAARAVAQVARPHGVRRVRGADGEDARSRHPAHRLHPQLDAHAGRRLGSRRARYVRRALSVLRRELGREDGRPALEVRRDHLPARRQWRRRRGGGRGGRGGGAADVPVPYKSTKEFPSLGFPDSTDDVRGALGEDGMKALYAFMQQGGTVITEGNTSQILPEMKLTPGVTSEPANGLFARGTILRAMIADAKSPLVYGYDKQRSAGVLQLRAGAERGRGCAGRRRRAAGRGGRGGSRRRRTPRRWRTRSSCRRGIRITRERPFGVATSIGNDFNVAQAGSAGGRGGRGGGGGGGGGFGGFGGGGLGRSPVSAPIRIRRRASSCSSRRRRKTCCSPARSSVASCCRSARGLVDEKIGNGHLVMFAFRPYWRWQTQGTFAMGFNAIMNWNDLDAGK